MARLGSRVIVQPCLVSLRRGHADVWLGSDLGGGFAQFVTVPAEDAHEVRTSLSDIELASFPCAYGTAENLLRRSGVIRGETVLVTGASGGLDRRWCSWPRPGELRYSPLSPPQRWTKQQAWVLTD